MLIEFVLVLLFDVLILTSDNFTISIRSVINDSLLISCSNVSCCIFFSLFNFLICTIKLWLCFFSQEISSSLSMTTLSNFFLRSWFLLKFMIALCLFLLLPWFIWGTPNYELLGKKCIPLLSHTVRFHGLITITLLIFNGYKNCEKHFFNVTMDKKYPFSPIE